MLQRDEDCSEYFSSSSFINAVDTLQEKEFVKGAFIEGHTLVAVRLLHKGRAYFEEYPSLRNPIDWKWIISTLINLHLMIGVIIVVLVS